MTTLPYANTKVVQKVLALYSIRGYWSNIDKKLDYRYKADSVAGYFQRLKFIFVKEY